MGQPHRNKLYTSQIGTHCVIIETDLVKRQIRREAGTQSHGPFARKGSRAAEGRVHQWDYPDFPLPK
jgi:hypothetical protein